jgi:hypothetical protein
VRSLSKYFLLGLACPCFGGFVLRAQLAEIPAPHVSFVRTVTSEQSMIAGEVTARTDLDFTILDRASELTTVQVTDGTVIVKGAVSIKLSDLAVGDKVTVTVTRGGDGKLQAVNVTVRVGNE